MSSADAAFLPATGKLLSAFFSTCEREFRFLEQDHSFAYLSGLARYHMGRQVITPYRPGVVVAMPFEAVTLYENNETSFAITYNGENFIPDLYVCYDRIRRLRFHEILKVARKPAFAALEIPPILKEEQMEQIFHDVTQAVRQHIDYILHPAAKLVERALRVREKQLEQKIREQFRRDLEETTQQAARAFTNRDYRRVIELLTPYERYVSFSNARKLDLARKNLLSI